MNLHIYKFGHYVRCMREGRDLWDLVRLAPFGFGGAVLGNLYETISESEAIDAVRRAWQSGVRYFDTAPYYGMGLSEQRLSMGLRDLPRREIVISTKVGRLLDPTNERLPSVRDGFAQPLPNTVRFDYGYDGVMRSYDDSLRRLGVDRIEILYAHDLGALTHGAMHPHYFAQFADGGYRAMDELRSSGAVDAIGLGVNETAVIDQAMAIGSFDCFLLAGRYTLLDQGPLSGFFDRAADHGARIVVGGVYNSGILATGTRSGQPVYFDYAPASPEVIARVARIEALCDATGVPMAAAALQFTRAHPVVATALVGLGSVDLVDHTLALARTPIPAEFWADLKFEKIIAANAPVPATAALQV